MRLRQDGFTIPELMVVIVITSIFTTLLLFFMISFWRYGLMLESDLDTLVTRLNAGDYVREAINPASGLIIQNSVPDTNAGKADPSFNPPNYWLPIHAIPSTIAMGANGTITPVVYFKRPSITTSKTVAMNGSLAYEDEYIFYLDGSTKSLRTRILANPNVANNRQKTTCPTNLASATCPADPTIAINVGSIQTRYFSKTGNLIDYTSVYDSVTNTYIGPDFPAVEVVEFTLNLTKKPAFQKSNSTSNSTVIRVALRS